MRQGRGGLIEVPEPGLIAMPATGFVRPSDANLSQYCSVRYENHLQGVPATTASGAEIAVRGGRVGQWPDAACSPWGLGLQRFGRGERTASFDA